MKNNFLAPRLLSQKEAASYLGISYWTLRDLLFRNEIPYVRVKRRLLVDRLDLDTYITRCKTPVRVDFGTDLSDRSAHGHAI